MDSLKNAASETSSPGECDIQATRMQRPARTRLYSIDRLRAVGEAIDLNAAAACQGQPQVRQGTMPCEMTIPDVPGQAAGQQDLQVAVIVPVPVADSAAHHDAAAVQKVAAVAVRRLGQTVDDVGVLLNVKAIDIGQLLLR